MILVPVLRSIFANDFTTDTLIEARKVDECRNFHLTLAYVDSILHFHIGGMGNQVQPLGLLCASLLFVLSQTVKTYLQCHEKDSYPNGNISFC